MTDEPFTVKVGDAEYLTPAGLAAVVARARSKGEPLRLLPWQRAIAGALFDDLNELATKASEKLGDVLYDDDVLSELVDLRDRWAHRLDPDVGEDECDEPGCSEAALESGYCLRHSDAPDSDDGR